MNLDEYKSFVETQRKESLANALSVLTRANAVLENTFSMEENDEI